MVYIQWNGVYSVQKHSEHLHSNLVFLQILAVIQPQSELLVYVLVYNTIHSSHASQCQDDHSTDGQKLITLCCGSHALVTRHACSATVVHKATCYQHTCRTLPYFTLEIYVYMPSIGYT